MWDEVLFQGPRPHSQLTLNINLWDVCAICPHHKLGVGHTQCYIIYCTQVGTGQACIKHSTRCQILTPDGTFVTFPTDSINFICLHGLNICHAICVTLYLPHITQQWCNLHFVQCTDLIKPYYLSWQKLLCAWKYFCFSEAEKLVLIIILHLETIFLLTHL